MLRRIGNFSIPVLISLMAILTLGPLGALTYGAVHLADDAVTSEAKARIRSTADVSALLVSDRFENLAELVDSYSDRPTLVEAVQEQPPDSRATIRGHLLDLQRREGVATAFLADRSGALIDIVPPTPSIVGADFSHRDWYRGVLRTKRPYVSEVYRTAAEGNPLVVAGASPVRVPGHLGERGKIIGFLVAAFDVNYFHQFVDDVAEEERTHLTITDQRGVVVAASGEDPHEMVSARQDQAVSRALSGRSGIAELGTGDNRVLSAYAAVPDIGFAVTASVPSKVALAGVDRLRTTVVGFAVSLALVLLTGLFFLALALKERRVIEKELAASEARTRAIIDAASDAYVSIDSEGTVVAWNAEAERMFGWPASEAFGRRVTDTIVATDSEAAAEGLLAFLAANGNSDQRVEFVAARRTGETFPVEASNWSTEEDGSFTYHAFITDVTERNRIHDEMLAAQLAAEQANRSKSEFLSRMSHELRTPMNGILGFAQLLEIEDGLQPEQQEGIQEITRAGKHLLDLINEVLDIARIESGKFSVSLEPVSLDGIVTECTSLIRPLVDQRGLTLTIEGGSEPIYASADHQRLKQLLLNLLSNATKYNRPNGRITVRYKALADSTVELSVADTGLGISSEKFERLFTPFDRLDIADEEEEGTGLGLALSKKLAEVMKGSLNVASEQGVGSSFSVLLPAAAAPLELVPVVPEASESTPSEIGDTTIIYVEDNIANVKLVERILKRRPGVTLHTVMQGQLGIDLARDVVPDLVLLDMNLPDMNGDDVLLRLQLDPVTKSIPVVILSADATPRQQTRMLAAGATAYVTKPLDVVTFLDTLDEILMKGHDYARTS